LSFGDVVKAKTIGGQPIVQAVEQRGGHSTYRLFLSSGIATSDDPFKKYWQPLESLGVTFERANDRLLSLDVPSHSDVNQAYELLQAGEDAGAWDFEEAHCGHALKK